MGAPKGFFIKYHTSLSSLMFMMAEIISYIYIYRPNDKVVVCMLLDARDTYPTKSDHIIILVYLYVFGCVLCLCCQLMFMTS